MKLILGVESDSVSVTCASATIIRAFTSGGFGKLPGDAVTSDIEENTARRVEVATSMPKERAIENMIRVGHDPDFAGRWVDATLVGGQTEANALDMIRQKSYPAGGTQIAIDPTALPASRVFRNAWRSMGSGVVVDMEAAKVIFARRMIEARQSKAKQLTDEIELAALTGQSADELEAAFAAMKAADLRMVGDLVMQAKTARELEALWPTSLGSIIDATAKADK